MKIMNEHVSRSVGYLCAAVVAAILVSKCGASVDDDQVRAISEACAKVGKEPLVVLTASKVHLGCQPQPAASQPN